MRKIVTNNVIKTLKWIIQKKNVKKTSLEPLLINNGSCVCIIYLPIIKKIILGIGETKLDSIHNATKQSSRFINQYLSENPNDDFKKNINARNYVFEENDNGCISLRNIE